MNIEIRPYSPVDYDQVKSLYEQTTLYGGQFDDNRDSPDRLQRRVEADPDAILVAQTDQQIVGTISLIEDGRVAWLFRFAVAKIEQESAVAQKLCQAGVAALRQKGHQQVLVYTPVGDQNLNQRYEELGFTKGNDFTCYWKDL